MFRHLNGGSNVSTDSHLMLLRFALITLSFGLPVVANEVNKETCGLDSPISRLCLPNIEKFLRILWSQWIPLSLLRVSRRKCFWTNSSIRQRDTHLSLPVLYVHCDSDFVLANQRQSDSKTFFQLYQNVDGFVWLFAFHAKEFDRLAATVKQSILETKCWTIFQQINTFP